MKTRILRRMSPALAGWLTGQIIGSFYRPIGLCFTAGYVCALAGLLANCKALSENGWKMPAVTCETETDDHQPLTESTQSREFCDVIDIWIASISVGDIFLFVGAVLMLTSLVVDL